MFRKLFFYTVSINIFLNVKFGLLSLIGHDHFEGGLITVGGAMVYNYRSSCSSAVY